MTGGMAIADITTSVIAVTKDVNGGNMNAANGAKTATTAIMTGIGVTGMDGLFTLGWDRATGTTKMHRRLTIRLILIMVIGGNS